MRARRVTESNALGKCGRGGEKTFGTSEILGLWRCRTDGRVVKCVDLWGQSCGCVNEAAAGD